MGKEGQKYRRHTVAFKRSVVALRLEAGMSLKAVCRKYQLNSENVIKWTRRFLAGEPLEMKRGRPRQTPSRPAPNLSVEDALRAENEHLKMVLAYKDEVIKVLEARESLKKKNDSPSSKN